LNQRTLYLLRHGEIATPGILAGKTDVALSEKGQQQLWQATEQLPDIAHCISSPLQRCQKFAIEFSDKNNIPLQLSQNLQEMNFGDWDGKQYQHLWELTGKDEQTSIGDFWQNPWAFTPPNGEPMDDFVRRVDQWWQQWLSNSAEGNTLVVAHGGVIKHLLARVLNMPMPGTTHMSHIDVPYAGLVKITVYTDEQGKNWPKIIL
jgi:alpha-ribazole phosphatase